MAKIMKVKQSRQKQEETQNSSFIELFSGANYDEDDDENLKQMFK